MAIVFFSELAKMGMPISIPISAKWHFSKLAEIGNFTQTPILSGQKG